MPDDPQELTPEEHDILANSPADSPVRLDEPLDDDQSGQASDTGGPSRQA